MKWLAAVITVALVFGLTGVTAGSTARNTVTVVILESTQLALSRDNNASGILPSADNSKDSLPTEQTDHSVYLSWASNVLPRHTSKITAQLGADCAPGIACRAALARPTGSNGTSAGHQVLSTSAVDMLTGIGNENCSCATIDYEVHPSRVNILPASATITVIWTITDAGGSNRDGHRYLGRHYYMRKGF
jgi:hypothetical protein